MRIIVNQIKNVTLFGAIVR